MTDSPVAEALRYLRSVVAATTATSEDRAAAAWALRDAVAAERTRTAGYLAALDGIAAAMVLGCEKGVSTRADDVETLTAGLAALRLLAEADAMVGRAPLAL